MASGGDDSKMQGSSGRRLPPNAGRGRKKGSVNKTTKTLKEALLASFETLGGEEWLVSLAESDPKAYASLLGRLVPSEIGVEVSAGDASVLPDGLLITPRSFSNRAEWDSFFSQVKQQPGSIVCTGGIPCPPGFEGDVFPIVRRVAGQWVCGGIPSASEMASYDLDFGPAPEPLP